MLGDYPIQVNLYDANSKLPKMYMFNLKITDHVVDEYGDEAATGEEKK